MKRLFRDALIIGLATFSSFFGAGNLIFPPKLGLETGIYYIVPLTGYLLSGVILPILTLLAFSRTGGSIEGFAKSIGKVGATILAVATFLIIGPLVAIPRTVATSYEFTKAALFPNISGSYVALLFSILYFAIVMFFVFSEEKVIDKLGKFLTPILLILLGIIIVKGLLFEATPMKVENPVGFKEGFFIGYQTMDALAAILFGSIIVTYLKFHKYDKMSERTKITGVAILITCFCLMVIYGGLCLIGVKLSSTIPNTLSRVDSLSEITFTLLGKPGQYILMLCVLFACLTTAIGLTACISEYFSRITNGTVTYKKFVIIISLTSCFLSVLGVETIVKLAGPILEIVYPIVIVLTITNLARMVIPNLRGCQRGALIGLGIFLIFEIVSKLDRIPGVNIDMGSMKSLIYKLPLASDGVGWLIPTAIAGIFGMIFIKGYSVSKESVVKKAARE